MFGIKRHVTVAIVTLTALGVLASSITVGIKAIRKDARADLMRELIAADQANQLEDIRQERESHAENSARIDAMDRDALRDDICRRLQLADGDCP